MKIVTAQQMRELDRRTIEEAGIPGATLMERAGAGVVTTFEKVYGSPSGKVITVFCGKGNNGGDGFVIAHLLKRKRAHVTVCLLADPRDLKGDARIMYRRFVKSAGLTAVQSSPTQPRMKSLTLGSDFCVDALLGTGLSSPVGDSYRTAIECMNASQRPIISVDLPSGVHADSGSILGTAIKASLTVTFGQPKLGCVVGTAIDQVGTLHIVDIGIPSEYVQAMNLRTNLLTRNTIRPWIPPRPRSAHKGTFGHVGIVAGSTGKSGAAALAAKAALRCGTGLVTLAIPEGLNTIMESLIVEAMTIPMPQNSKGSLSRDAGPQLEKFLDGRSALAIGPGLSTCAETVELLTTWLPTVQIPICYGCRRLECLRQPDRSTSTISSHADPHPSSRRNGPITRGSDGTGYQ